MKFSKWLFVSACNQKEALPYPNPNKVCLIEIKLDPGGIRTDSVIPLFQLPMLDSDLLPTLLAYCCNEITFVDIESFECGNSPKE